MKRYNPVTVTPPETEAETDTEGKTVNQEGYRKDLPRGRATPCLYRHFDVNGELLYVGITLFPLKRIRQHRRSKWFRDIRTVEIEHHKTLKDARHAEAKAIRDENPIFNLTRYDGGRGNSRKPLRCNEFGARLAKSVAREAAQEMIAKVSGA